MLSKVVTIAVSLKEETARKVMDELSREFTGFDFSIKKSQASGTWSVIASTKHIGVMYLQETDKIKIYCMNFIKEKGL